MQLPIRPDAHLLCINLYLLLYPMSRTNFNIQWPFAFKFAQRRSANSEIGGKTHYRPRRRQELASGRAIFTRTDSFERCRRAVTPGTALATHGTFQCAV